MSRGNYPPAHDVRIPGEYYPAISQRRGKQAADGIAFRWRGGDGATIGASTYFGSH